MARSQGGDYRGEGPGAVVRPVVGNDPHEPGDPVGGEEGPGAAEEADRGGGLRLGSTAPVGPPASPGWEMRPTFLTSRCGLSGVFRTVLVCVSGCLR